MNSDPRTSENSSAPEPGPVLPPEAQPRMLRVEGLSARPVVTYTIMGLTILIFALQLGSEFMFGGDWPAAMGLKANDYILQGELWRLITPVLLHGSIVHILFNMYSLYAIGPGMESNYGHGRFLILYLLGAFAGNVLSFMFSSYNSLGASTAIFGVFAAEGIFIYQNQDALGPRARSALTQIVVLALINLANGLRPGAGIDNWGHIGGLVGGALFAWFAGPVIEREIFYDRIVISDRREGSQVLLAAVLVGALFAALAAITFFQRGGQLFYSG